MAKEDPPIVTVKVSNPLTYIKSWWRKVIGNEGIVFSFRIKPLTALLLAVVITSILTGAGYSLGKFAVPEPIVKYVPGLAITPTPSPWKETAFTGSLKYTPQTHKYYLVTTASEAITLEVPDNIDLSGFTGRRILAVGNYNKSSRILVVSGAQDMEVLPTKAITIPTLTPVPETSAGRVDQSVETSVSLQGEL